MMNMTHLIFGTQKIINKMRAELDIIYGDLIKFAKNGMFDVVTHGCNCLSNMGAGLAPQMAKEFGCDKFKMEEMGPTIDKLGCIDYETLYWEDDKRWTKYPDEGGKFSTVKLTVVNSYTQFKYNSQKPLDYEALTLCMRKINHTFKGKHIGLPQIGAGLAGGDWNRIKGIIENELRDCQVTVVIYKK
jgi:O-acetyl-ADP-ribose deacetylase (regulator of RNase III)